MARLALIYVSAFLALAYVLSKVIYRQHQLRKFSRIHDCDLPSQTPNTLLGLPQIFNLLQALKKNQFLNYVQELFRQYGSTFAYNTFGTQSIWTMDPENIHACLVSQSQEFEVGPARHKAIIPLLGHSVLTSDGAIWSHHRGIMRKNFVKTQLEDLSIFEKHFENFVACVPKDGSTFEVRGLLSKLTMDISTDFLLGCSTNSLTLHANQTKDEFSEAWNIAMGWIPLRCHLGALMNWIPHPSFFEACKTIHTYADQLVAESLASTLREKTEIQGSRYIFLHEMAKDIKDPVQLRDHAISILTAGRDTTAETLSGIINMLLKHPDVLALLRQEIGQLNSEKPTSATIKEMRYLRNVINEVLRLYPVGPVNARIATKDTTLPVGGGPDGMQPILVKNRQQVLYCVYGLHRRKDLYGDDAEEFRPERWNSRRQGWDFLPFNSGARNCLGQSFATTEISYILVRLLQEFEVLEARGLRPWRENLGLILTNFHGTYIGLRKEGSAYFKNS